MMFDLQMIRDFLFSLDAFATSIALTATVLLAKNDRRGWPVCILAILVDTVFNYQRELGGQFLLAGMYLVTTCYGWWQWDKQDSLEIPANTSIRSLTLRNALLYALASIGLFFLFLQIIRALPFSSMPLWDALATTLSFIAQWLLTRRYLQSWLLWFVADLVTAGLYYYKAAYWHASLYMIYLVIATIAYYKWSALMTQKNHQRS